MKCKFVKGLTLELNKYDNSVICELNYCDTTSFSYFSFKKNLR